MHPNYSLSTKKKLKMIKKIIDKLGYGCIILVFGILFLRANKIDRLSYSPYQMLSWEIKANEGFRNTWYKDPGGNGSYCIGFGWNDLGGKRRYEAKKYMKGGKISFDDATKLTVSEIQKYGTLNKDPLKNLALQLYSYNCGLTKSGSRLGKCCNSKTWGCGRKSKNIRDAHNRRRKYELALWNHDYVSIEKYTQENREKLARNIQFYKSKNQYK